MFRDMLENITRVVEEESGEKKVGYRIIPIESFEDLEDVDMDFLLYECPWEDLEGCYIDTGDVEEYVPVRKEKVTFLAVVHGRPSHEEVEADVDAEGNYYIPEEEFDNLF